MKSKKTESKVFPVSLRHKHPGNKEENTFAIKTNKSIKKKTVTNNYIRLYKYMCPKKRE